MLAKGLLLLSHFPNPQWSPLNVWVPSFWKYPSPLMTRDPGPRRMEGLTMSDSLWPIGVFI